MSGISPALGRRELLAAMGLCGITVPIALRGAPKSGPGSLPEHDVPNLFVTEGAAMPSSAQVNPSLTFMAFTARAAAFAADVLKSGSL